MNFVSQIKQSSRELILFAAAALALGMAFQHGRCHLQQFPQRQICSDGFPAFLFGIPA